MPKFSVITPVHIHSEERRDQLFRAIASLQRQTFQDYEHIIVNDGSTLETDIPKDLKTLVVNTLHYERIISYNTAFATASGEWFVCLDSDDELADNALERFNFMIENFEKEMDFKLFNCGSKFIHKDGKESDRGPFEPKMLEVGHEEFGPGNIVNGTFIWHRSVYEDLGAFPEAMLHGIDCSELNYGNVRELAMTSPWDFSAIAQIQFPEIRKYFFIDRENEPNKAIRELGNPWGQDFYLFYKYTRKYHSLPFDEPLYIVHLK